MDSSSSRMWVPLLIRDRRRRLAWGGLLAGTALILGVALLPPLLSPEWRAFVMHLFAPVCHQMPGRSPVLGGVQIAICDRCVGIYLGLVMGVAAVGGLGALWQRVGEDGRYLLLGSLVPMGLDWIGPVLGLWHNVPTSRALTGLLFGIVAASFVSDRLLRAIARTGGPTTERRECGQ